MAVDFRRRPTQDRLELLAAPDLVLRVDVPDGGLGQLDDRCSCLEQGGDRQGAGGRPRRRASRWPAVHGPMRHALMSGGSMPAAPARSTPDLVRGPPRGDGRRDTAALSPDSWTRPSESMPRPASSWSPMVATSRSLGVPSTLGIRADECREHVGSVPGAGAPLTPYPDRERSRPAQMPVPLARGANGAVASPHHLATEAGIGILRSGGSAVDAAIATNAALAVVAGHSCGLGGDAFWLIADPASAAVVALNGSGRSAAGATPDAAAAAGLSRMPERGPWSVTVPGAVDSWGEAHRRFGRLAWADLLAPAIELADGFPASAGWVGAVERAAAIFGDDGDWARTYRPEGRRGALGERVRLPALGRTLRTLAAEGPGVLYTGALAARAATYLAARRFPHPRGRPRRASLRLGRADLHHVSRPDLAEPPAQQLWRGRARDPRHPRPPGATAPAAFDGLGVADARWVHLGLEASRIALADRDRWLTDIDAMEPWRARAVPGS